MLSTNYCQLKVLKKKEKMYFEYPFKRKEDLSIPELRNPGLDIHIVFYQVSCSLLCLISSEPQFL